MKNLKTSEFFYKSKKFFAAGLTVTAIMNAACTYIFMKAFGRKKEELSSTAPCKKNTKASGKKSKTAQKDQEKYAAFINKKKEWLSQRSCEEIHLKSYDGLCLYGRLYVPGQAALIAPSPTVILCIHGYHSDGPGDFAAFAPFYTEQGYIFCLVDDRAHGKSEGKYIGFGYHDRFDCLAWTNYLSKRFGPDCQIYLHGISMGAATVLSCCDSKHLPHQVRGIISDCAYSSGWDQVAHVMQFKMHLPAFPMLPIYNKVCKALGGYSLKDISPISHVRQSKVPILFIHGDADHFVPTTMVYKLYHASKCQKRLLTVHGAAHALSYLVDPKSYERAFKDFIVQT